ncbi:N-acetylmuramoyl-L-alanine amidase [Clostridium cibarium]|uniref:N-acetylmuramoyl-L-alanine amidase n=1 Tax=Clostridium cibarium TaxID=2762247 RepID=A0ABR8PW65_9CLOT|nr:N-acetylmuramoyl-L-alanine amidase [Clostridium cibarium]MBD7912425.1 N-acetylmuramoyl-L-alanine amidase [Clostridium cibarium]
MKYIKDKRILVIAFLCFCVAAFLLVLTIKGKDDKEAKVASADISEVTEVKDKLVIKPLENDIEIVRPLERKTSTSEEHITFLGMSDPNKELKLNNENIQVYYTGNFVKEVPLKIGINSFQFTLGDKVVNYEVIRKFQIIDSITPAKILSVEGGTKITITAKLYSGSKAYAELNGKRIEFNQVESDEYISARGTTYATFTGDLLTEEVNSKTSLGHIVIHSSFEGKEESKEGGEVVLNTKEREKKYGIINKESALVYDSKTTSVVPLNEVYPLAKGTEDYITSKVIIDDKEYYNLASNKRIKAEDMDLAVTKVNNGNEISNISIYEENNSTILKIKESSKAPYTFKAENAGFKDIKNQDYSIDNYDLDEMKIYFDYANSINDEINLEDNPLIKEASVSNNEKYLSLKLKDRYIGHRAYYDEEGNLIFKFKNKKKSLKDMTIVLDPGHGLIENSKLDPGALGFNHINENIINVQMSKLIEGQLKEKGANVIRLDTENTAYPLKERGGKARENDADLYLSIHNNSGGSGKYNATESYYFTPYSESYSKNINESLAECYNNVLFKENKGEYNRGSKYNYYTVTLERENPSVLVEVGYIDNPVSFNKIINNDYQAELAKSIVKGIENSIE